MPIKRYLASADNTITNAYQPNFKTRGTGSNMGASDVLETFSIYGHQSSKSQELSRILIKFPITSITADRTAERLPSSGKVKFYLRLHNAETSKTVPKNFKLLAQAVSRSWEDGDGLDMEEYKDTTDGNKGSNWVYASKDEKWDSVGGDYLTSSTQWDLSEDPPTYEKTFDSGLEDIEMDITTLVEHWIADETDNNGIGIRLAPSYEASSSLSAVESDSNVIYNPDGATVSYYTKRFFGHGTQYFFKRPVIEARWSDVQRDNRSGFHYSSSLAPASDNLNTIYLYNYIRGVLTDIPAIGTGEILVSLYSGSNDNSSPSGSKLTLYDAQVNATGGQVSTGIYSCSVAVTASSTPIKTLYDVWHDGTTEYYTGSITPKTHAASGRSHKTAYFINITNLRQGYSKDENARVNVYIRNKHWSPTIYTKAKSNPEHTPIHSASYRVIRTIDALEVVPHNTGSDYATGLSYNVSGNYFNFNMKLLDPGYEYGFKIAFYDEELRTWLEQDKIFKFRVLNNEY